MTTTPADPVQKFAEDLYRDTVTRLNKKLKAAHMKTVALFTFRVFDGTQTKGPAEEQAEVHRLHEEAEKEAVETIMCRVRDDQEFRKIVREYVARVKKHREAAGANA